MGELFSFQGGGNHSLGAHEPMKLGQTGSKMAFLTHTIRGTTVRIPSN